MFDLLKSLFGIGGKALDKIFPDRAKLQEKNLEINAETERASSGRMTPRKLMMYLLCVLFAWEAVARPILITYWPDLTLTTAKINTMTARLMDLLFPQRVKNWAIEPTPDPMLPDDVVMQDMQDEISAAAEQIMGQTMQGLQAQNTVPDMWAAQNLMAEAFQQAFQQVDTTSARVRIAKDRATAMERVIDDQLRECNANGQRRPSWQQNCRSVVKSACLYGMGVLSRATEMPVISPSSFHVSPAVSLHFRSDRAHGGGSGRRMSGISTHSPCIPVPWQ